MMYYSKASFDPVELKTAVPALSKKFPAHQGIAGIILQYNEMMAKKNVAPPVGFESARTA